MTRRLMSFGHRESQYDRPNHDWVCGRLAEGAPCRIGPDRRGRCRAGYECTPRREGARWLCTRPQNAGGRCPEGPRPDGTCCRPVRRCVPLRSVRARRGLTARWAAALTVGVLVLAFAGWQGAGWLSPGALDAAHAGIEDCGTCHADFEGGPSAWLHAAFAGADPGRDSRKCLSCHALGDQPMRPHSLPAQILQASTEAIAERGRVQRYPLQLAFAANTFAPSPAETEQVACATCHSEHQGTAGGLTAMENGRCQACHSVKFSGFAGNHPDFAGYPYERRTRLVFDHVAHFDKHFPEEEAEAPEACGDCHTPAEDGRKMLVRGFGQVCGACHRGEIVGRSAAGAKGVAVLSVPGLDLQILREREIGIGHWPEFADRELSPFMALLLAADPEARAPLRRVRSLDPLDLRGAEAADVEAVAEVAWAVKELFADIQANGTAALRERLNAALGRELPPEQANRLVGTLPMDAVQAAQSAWFPDLASEVARHRGGEAVPIPPSEFAAEGTGETEEPAADEGEAAQGGDILGGEEPEGGDILGGEEEPEGGNILGGEEPEGGDILGGEKPEGGDILGGEEPEGGDILGGEEPEGGDILGGDEPEGGLLADDEAADAEEQPEPAAEVPSQVKPEEWAAAGGWYRDYFALLYRPQGHADPFYRAWLSASAAAFGTPAEARAEPVFEALAEDDAPGKCAKCHSVDRTPDGGRVVNWQPAHPQPRRREFTAFAHVPHEVAVGGEGCKTCHKPNPEADYLASFDDRNLATFAPSFRTLDKATCAGCHVESAAGDDCLQCHRYHVGTFPVARIHTSVSNAAGGAGAAGAEAAAQ